VLRNFTKLAAWADRTMRRTGPPPHRTKALRGHRLVAEQLETRLVLNGGPLVISEFLAINDAGITQDADGDYSDWIEIHNPTDSPIDLGDWYLTDDNDDLTKWRFPGISLGSHEYQVVFASGEFSTASQSTPRALKWPTDSRYSKAATPTAGSASNSRRIRFDWMCREAADRSPFTRQCAQGAYSQQDTTSLQPLSDLRHIPSDCPWRS